MSKYLSTIPPGWFLSCGQGARVAVCDIGIDIKHNPIRHAVREYKTFGGTRPSAHGTGVVSIICARPRLLAFRGLAVNADLIVADVPYGGWSDYTFLCQALDWVAGKEPDVLNLSIAYGNDSEEIRTRLERLDAAGTIIVTAHALTWQYPHQYPFVISATCESDVAFSADIVAPGEFSVEGFNGKLETLYGSSMATALVSSVAALAKGNDKGINREQFLKTVCGADPLAIKTGWVVPPQEQVNLDFD